MKLRVTRNADTGYLLRWTEIKAPFKITGQCSAEDIRRKETRASSFTVNR